MNSEQARLQTIREFDLFKAEENQSLNELMAALAKLLNLPVALVSIIDEHEQFFKGKFGFEASCTRREDAFCNVVVALKAPLHVKDASLDSRFAQNPLVTDNPHIRFYAGVPLKLNQQNIGAVCVIDMVPRELSEEQFAVLEKFSAHVSAYLELLSSQRQLQQAFALVDDSPAVLIKWQPLPLLKCVYLSNSIESLFQISRNDLLLQNNLIDFIDKDQQVEYQFLFKHHEQGLSLGQINLQLHNRSGRQFWVRLLTKAFFDASGQLQSIHGLLTDNTNQHFLEQKINDANQQMRMVLDASGLGTWTFDLVAAQMKVNRRWCEMLGLDLEFYDPHSYFWRSLIHPADLNELDNALQTLATQASANLQLVYRLRHAKGYWVWIEIYGKVAKRNSEGKILQLSGTHRDISANKIAELNRQKQSRMLSFLNKAHTSYLRQQNLTSACDEILPELLTIADSQFGLICQLKTSKSKSQFYIKAIALKAIEDVMVSNLLTTDISLPIEISAVQVAVQSGEKYCVFNEATDWNELSNFINLPLNLQHGMMLAIADQTTFYGIILLFNKIGGYHAQDAEFLQPVQDALSSLFYAVNLIESKQKVEQQLQHLAVSDPLTKLANRRGFIDYCANLQKEAQSLVFAIIDIDNFSTINRQYGLNIGDAVIQQVAERLHSQLRPDDLLARLGSDEFVLVMPNIEIDTVTLLLENIRLEFLGIPLRIDKEDLFISLSIGARYVMADEDLNIDQQIQEADEALNKAKNVGGACLMWF